MKDCIPRGLALWAALLAASALAQDWPQWRGPNRDGVTSRFETPAAWPEKLRKVWSLEVGEGHASPVIVGESAYCFSRQGESEIIRRVELATGRAAWTQAYPAPYRMNPAAQAHGKGPKSTPVVANGRVYTFGISGILSCLEASTGRLLWRKDPKSQVAPLFGVAMSPLVEKGVLYVHTGTDEDGAMIAYDAINGREKWRWAGDGPGYASPVIVPIDGVPNLVAQSHRMIVGLHAENGRLLWSLPFKTPYEQNIVTPALAGDLIVLAGLQNPTFAIRVSRKQGKWLPEQVWENREAMMYMSSPVVAGGRIYAMSNRRRGQLVCLSARNGELIWTDEGDVGENASLIATDKHVLVMEVGGDLRVLERGTPPREVRRYKVSEAPVWASLAVSGKRILVKNATHLSLHVIP